ncbi:MAG: hypothetical protein AB1938_28020 [Myxococcota bacterium]
MSLAWAELRALVLAAYRTALSAALPPKPQVARHWETPDALHWLALMPATDGFHLAYSLGRLRGAALVEGERHTSGLFRLSGAVFPGVDEAALLRAVHVQVPEAADGATRAFLVRVAAQVAVAETALTLEQERRALPLPTSADFACHVPARADALFEPAATPRLLGHAAERVHAAISAMDGALAARVLALFAAPEPTLLEALRHLGSPRA